MKTIGIILMALAVLVAVAAPLYTCEHDGKSITLANGKKAPMKCLWTAMAAIAGAIPIFGVGALQVFSRQRETRRATGALGILSGVSLILLPTLLIGVCPHQDAICNLVLRPGLIFIGGLVSILSVLGAVSTGRLREQAA